MSRAEEGRKSDEARRESGAKRDGREGIAVTGVDGRTHSWALGIAQADEPSAGGVPAGSGGERRMRARRRWRVRRRFGVGLVVLAVAGFGVVGCSNGGRAQPAAIEEPSPSADLEPFLRSYFETWSRGDMEGYRDHFHPRATIYFVRGGSVLSAMPLDPFIEGQSRSQASEPRGRERMTSFRADEDRQGATVRAEWELVEGEEITRGIDRFTLIRDEHWQWKILSLTFYATSHDRSGRGDRR